MKKSLFICLTVLGCCLAAVTFTDITEMSQLPNGDAYNQTLPTSVPTMFAGKKVALLVGNYAEDTEVYYEYSYFSRRGANIEILTPSGGTLVIADFIKADYIVYNTTAIRDRVNEPYFLVYVSGGSPSSKAIRASTDAQTLMYSQWAAGRWLAVICSGAETLVDIGLAKDAHLTGSPTSRTVLEMAGAHYHYVPVVRHANLIVGQGPTYQYDFAAAIDAAVSAATSTIAPPPTPAEPALVPHFVVAAEVADARAPSGNGLGETADIDPTVFHPVATPKDLPLGIAYDPARPPVSDPTLMSGRRVALIVSHTTSQFDVDYLQRFFTERAATVDVYAPGWQVSKGVVLNDGLRPTALGMGALETTPTPPRYDLALVPGGMAWLSTVLRSDDATGQLLWAVHASGGAVGGVGMGVEVLGGAGLLKGAHVAGDWRSQADLANYGATYHNAPLVEFPAAPNDTALPYPVGRGAGSPRILTARSSGDLYAFALRLESLLAVRVPPQPLPGPDHDLIGLGVDMTLVSIIVAATAGALALYVALFVSITHCTARRRAAPRGSEAMQESLLRN